MEIIEKLKLQAEEIAEERHAGWGNTMMEAAEKIEIMESAIKTFVERVEKGEVRSVKTYNQFKDILGL